MMNANSNSEVMRFMMPIIALRAHAAMMPLVWARSRKISCVTHVRPKHHARETTMAMIDLISTLCSRIS